MKSKQQKNKHRYYKAKYINVCDIFVCTQSGLIKLQCKHTGTLLHIAKWSSLNGLNAYTVKDKVYVPVCFHLPNEYSKIGCNKESTLTCPHFCAGTKNEKVGRPDDVDRSSKRDNQPCGYGKCYDVSFFLQNAFISLPSFPHTCGILGVSCV